MSMVEMRYFSISVWSRAFQKLPFLPAAQHLHEWANLKNTYSPIYRQENIQNASTFN